MNTNAAKNLMFAFACMARIEGMKAENAKRACRNEEPTYKDDDFRNEAGELERLATDTGQWSHIE